MNIQKDKILIADDSELSFKAISGILEILSKDVELFYAEDGRKACDMAIEIIPDLILMDVIMPEMNGIEAVKYLRSVENTAEIPIIVLSATESLEAAYNAGANDFISKPFHKHELLIKVRSALSLVKNLKAIRQQKKEVENKHSEVVQKNEELTQQRKDIIANIRYSKRIQKAILPGDQLLSSALREHFILNIPRNIVSGDFYWVGNVNGKSIVAVADCTGHGISGAFMTVAGIAFLNEILRAKDFTIASDVLYQLRDLVMKLLQQKGKEGEMSDGMDISLVILNEGSDQLYFSGANNPLYVIHEGEMKIFKGDRMPIGIHLNFNQPFTNHSLKVEKGDMLYLFSDGYADQFGGPRNKKFRYRQFQELLLSIYNLPLGEQKEKLYRTMIDWKGDNDQVDDILILGFRI